MIDYFIREQTYSGFFIDFEAQISNSLFVEELVSVGKTMRNYKRMVVHVNFEKRVALVSHPPYPTRQAIYSQYV